MGCDIHLHIEVKIDDVWEHWSAPSVPRCYPLFNKIAGVRAYDNDIVPLTTANGLPEKLSIPTQVAYEWEKPDAHHTGYLNRKQIVELEEWIRTELVKTWCPDSEWLCIEAHFLHSYCCGNGFAGIGQQSDSYPASITDVRFVFWFDC